MKRIGPFSKLLRNILKTVGASGVQFLITLCTTPIMTRLYDPTAYASFGLINGAAGVMVGVGLLSLPTAYTMQKEAAERAALMHSTLILLSGLVLIAILVVFLMGSIHLDRDTPPISPIALIMLPLLVLTLGIRQILTNIAIQRANFTHLSFSRIIEPVCSRGGSIALGAALGGHPAFILCSVVVGYFSTISILLRMLPKKILGQWKTTIFAIPHFFSTLSRFLDFIVFNTASQQVLSVTMLGVQMMMAAYFSTHAAGQYILAISILALPITLIALATAPVTYNHFLETMRNNSSSLAKHLLLFTALYGMVGVCLLLPIFLFGPQIFAFAFGPVWVEAGKIAATLSIPYMLSFALTGVQSIFIVTGQLKAQFKLEAFTSLLTFLATAMCFNFFALNTAITCLAALWLLRNCIMIATCILVATRYSRNAA